MTNKKLSNTNYVFNTNGKRTKLNQAGEDFKDRYSDTRSREIIGNLFKSIPVDEEEVVISGYKEDDYEEEYNSLYETSVKIETVRDTLIDKTDFQDPSYMDYINSMSRSARYERIRGLEQPESIRQSAARETAVKQRKDQANEKLGRLNQQVAEYEAEEFVSRPEPRKSIPTIRRLGNPRMLTAAAGVVVLVIFCFLVSKINTLNAQLKDIQSKSTDVSVVQDSNQTLSIENDGLRTEIETLKKENDELNQRIADADTDIQISNNDSEEDPEDGTVGAATEAPSQSTPPAASNSAPSSNPKSGSTYVVKQGDNFWSIAQKAYGNGARYTEIMSANNIDSEKGLTIGLSLMIP